ncbi:MAG TPA: c-type cytochrome [Bosea sp. (in: a-proteobacteria)]|uniref:c-type cytochrome n=1 Tax=Bosea sp. (in: a-proteobacteria) TaxID=1871050 RepID=UPI002DDD8BB7|nr:c-type cytochrome [Bosea sp. (in: a-proteobacteria)]HEV2552338.1 c-type cytochrome [Bosea sp. (in: a-proteobacteria)]
MRETRTSRPMCETAAFARAGLAALAFALAGAGAAMAQVAGDAQAGRAVATALCRPCHAIDGASRDPARVPPDFGAVADMPSQTALSLRVFLQTPHGNMPRYQLTATETDDVIAYVLSLRAR